jgi:hypothetical protein
MNALNSMLARSILVGSLQPSLRPVGYGKDNACRGVARFTGGHRAVVAKKVQSLNHLAAECFCNLLAGQLGFNVPQCAIVQHPDGEWWFASVDVDAPNLLQRFNAPIYANQEEMRPIADVLAAWKDIGRLIAFDLLVMNTDRNTTNLLTDGADFWLIDHALSMGLAIWNGHALYRLIRDLCNPMFTTNVEAAAIAQSLTIPPGCHSLPEAELEKQPLLGALAATFGDQISRRLPTIASSVPEGL